MASLTLDEALKQSNGRISHRYESTHRGWLQVTFDDGWQGVYFRLSDYEVYEGSAQRTMSGKVIYTS